MKKQVSNKTSLKRIVTLLCLSSFICLGHNAWADYASFENDAMSSLSDGCQVTTGSSPVLTADKSSTFTYYDGTAGGIDDNNCKPNNRAWMIGAKIEWPWRGARYNYASFDLSRNAFSQIGVGTDAEGTYDVGSGTGLEAYIENRSFGLGSINFVRRSYWWAWITPDEVYAAQLAGKDTITQTLKLGAGNYGVYYGVSSRTFTIAININGLELKDKDGVLWFPAVATNAAGKVYGDLNVALKEETVICAVANASIDAPITNKTGLVFRKGAYEITGLDKLTLLDGSYDFDPSAVGCTLGSGCVATHNDVTGLWDVAPCTHNWKYEIIDNGATFKATCDMGCGYTPQSLTISLSTLSKVYDGQELTASLRYNKTAEEFAKQTGAMVGAIEWNGDKKSAGNHTASVTITDREGGTHTISQTATITAADMSTATVKLANTSVNFADVELENSIASVTSTAGITASDWEVVDANTLCGNGSGYSNVTYTVTLQGKGNYTGTQTVTWTVVAPTRALGDMGRGDFEMNSQLYNDNYGECDQATRTLNVTSTTNIIFINGAWYVGMTVDLPVTTKWLSPSTSVLTDDEHLRVRVSTTGKTYTGTQINGGTASGLDVMLTGDHASYSWSGIGEYQYFKSLRWYTPVSPAMIEQAKKDGKEYLEFTMTVGGITFNPYTGATWEGFAYKDFTIKVPVDGFIFKVGRNEYNTADIGNVKFTEGTPKILLQDGSVVTNACKIDYTDKKYIYTDVVGNEVLETKESETCYVYSSETVADVTIPNVAHQASKVVKLGEQVLDPLDVDKTKYRVHEGDTLTITYTAEAGYVPATAERTMENVVPGAELTDLPVFIWPSVTVQAEALEHATKVEIYTNGVLVGVTPCEVSSNDMVTAVYKADAGYFFYDESSQEYSASNKLATVKADANPIVISNAGALPLVKAAAMIGEAYYPTLDLAVANAKANDTIKLLKDCASDGLQVSLPVTLELNGQNLTNKSCTITGALTIENGASAGGLLNSGTVTVSGTLDMSSLTWGVGGFIPTGSGKFNLAENSVVKMGSPDGVSPNGMNSQHSNFITAKEGATVVLQGISWVYREDLNLWGKGGKAMVKKLVNGYYDGFNQLADALVGTVAGDEIITIDSAADLKSYQTASKEIAVVKAADLAVEDIPARYGWQGNTKLWPFVQVQQPTEVKYRDVELGNVPYVVTTNGAEITTPVDIFSNDQVQVVYTIDTNMLTKWRFTDGSTAWTNAFNEATTDPVVFSYPKMPMEYMPYYVGEVYHECYNWTNITDILTLSADRTYKYIDGGDEMWVVVRSNLDEDVRPVEIRGNVHLIIQDNVNVTIDAPDYSEMPGLTLVDDASLSVYAQSESFDQGVLEIVGDDYAVGIAGESASFAINSGYVAVSGDEAGIVCADLTINGGTLYVDGSDGVEAITVTINGGELNANGYYAGLTADDITLNGGTATITGGESDAIYAWNKLLVNSGKLSATCWISYSGIYANDFVIDDGEVEATGNGEGVGINCQTATINGGKVTVHGSSQKAGIYAAQGATFDENASYSDGYMATLPAGSTDEEAKAAVATFIDERVKNNITNVVSYNEFIGWAMQLSGCSYAAEQSAHTWVTYKLGAAELFADEPKTTFDKQTNISEPDTEGNVTFHCFSIVSDGTDRHVIDPAKFVKCVVASTDIMAKEWTLPVTTTVVNPERSAVIEFTAVVNSGSGKSAFIKLDFDK